MVTVGNFLLHCCIFGWDLFGFLGNVLLPKHQKVLSNIYLVEKLTVTISPSHGLVGLIGMGNEFSWGAHCFCPLRIWGQHLKSPRHSRNLCWLRSDLVFVVV